MSHEAGKKTMKPRSSVMVAKRPGSQKIIKDRRVKCAKRCPLVAEEEAILRQVRIRKVWD
jgi:hypothetical protein